MARSIQGQDDHEDHETNEPRHEFQRRSSILDLENKTLLEQLNALDSYKDFLTWNTKDQEKAFDKMVELLNETKDLCRQVDKILNDKDKAEYMAQEQQQENMVHTHTITQKDGVIEYIQLETILVEPVRHDSSLDLKTNAPLKRDPSCTNASYA